MSPSETCTGKVEGPLAWRMRPGSLEDFIGQKHLFGPGKILKSAVKAFSSLILYGPPGSGKTTLARVISLENNSAFFELNAVSSGVADLKRLIKKAEEKAQVGARTTVFIDEIHRFNKSQQSVLLPAVEQGIITFIGASTQNPYFSIIPALSSRSHLLALHTLSKDNIKTILHRALQDKTNGLGKYNIKVDEDTLGYIAACSGCDARKALNCLEIAFFASTRSGDSRLVSMDSVREILAESKVVYDRQDDHYETISAFIKSIRGSAPDAAIYWLAKMIVAGEDPVFIARRLVISAAEDIGNADPHALMVAVAALDSVRHIGMPEGRIPLSQATIYLALAPKSNAAYLAIDKAIQEVRSGGLFPVPEHLKNKPVGDSINRNNNDKNCNESTVKYRYPHDFKNHFVKQDYLGAKRKFYQPTTQGFESYLKQRIEELWDIDSGSVKK